MFTVYVLRSLTTGQLYTGQTNDMQRRFVEHQEGMSGYTRKRGPWEIVLTEEYLLRSQAMAREKYLKSGKGREWIKEIVLINKNKPDGRASPPAAD